MKRKRLQSNREPSLTTVSALLRDPFDGSFGIDLGT